SMMARDCSVTEADRARVEASSDQVVQTGPGSSFRRRQSAYVDRLSVAIANANRLWRRYYGPNGEQNLQTELQTESKKAAPKGG
ncbi:hypothetical protein, partial [Cronobacter sakazakii]|uniref:hypothetical protein n=1 Tax=Cronobacter sakazakii TaxID=28141 RepID=UPI001F3C725A